MVGATTAEFVMLGPGNPATGQVLPGRSFGSFSIPAAAPHRWLEKLHDRWATDYQAVAAQFIDATSAATLILIM